MIECTFINYEDEDRAELTKHMHWNHLVKSIMTHLEITFILYHFSGKYKMEEIEKLFNDLSIPNIIVWNSN